MSLGVSTSSKRIQVQISKDGRYIESRFAFLAGFISLPSMPKIIFQKAGLSFEWTGDDESILELAEANGLDLDYGCRMGNCTACQQPVITGEVEYPNGHTGEPDTGHALLCCCQPRGDADVVFGA